MFTALGAVRMQQWWSVYRNHVVIVCATRVGGVFQHLWQYEAVKWFFLKPLMPFCFLRDGKSLMTTRYVPLSGNHSTPHGEEHVMCLVRKWRCSVECRFKKVVEHRVHKLCVWQHLVNGGGHAV